MFSIVISEKGGAERRETYDRTEINVGRVQGNDLMLPKGNVSKRHARLLFRDGRFIVTDLKSTNGTYVNGRKIAQATIVREGDKIYIGDFVLKIDPTGEAVLGQSSPDANQSSPGQAGPSAGGSGAPAALEDSHSDNGEASPKNAQAAATPQGAQFSTAAPGPLRPASVAPPAAPQPPVPPQPPQGASVAPPPPPNPPPSLNQSGAAQSVPMSLRPSGAPPAMPNAAPTGFPAPPPMISPAPVAIPAAPLPAQVVPQIPAPQPQPQPPQQPAPQPPAPQPVPVPATFHPPPVPAPLPAPAPLLAPTALSPQQQAAVAQHAIPAGGPPPPPAYVPSPASAAGPPAANFQSNAPGAPSASSSGLRPAISSGPVPSPMPSSKRVDQPPIEPSAAAAHRSALAKLVERTVQSFDVSSLLSGAPVDPNLAAQIERVLRDKVGTLANEIPPNLSAELLVAEAKRELCELGPIGPLLDDEDVEEVQVIRHDHVVAIHDRKQIATEIAFTSELAVQRIVRRLCHRANQPLQQGEVFVERRLNGGGRMFGVLPPASGDAHMLVFRKPKRALQTLDDLVRAGTISRAIATLLGHAVAGRANILVTGAVNSGTTTLLGALAAAGGIDDRLVVLQEDDDIVFNQPHTVSVLIGDTAESGAQAVRAAIRVRPDRLVVGTFAGHVVAEVVDAVGDGTDGVLAAARAPTLRHLCQRAPADLAATRGLVTVDTAREWIAAAFDLVIEIARLRDGRHRVMRVAEFILHEKAQGELSLRDIFNFSVERTAAGGAVEGSFHPTGEIPRVMEDLVARGASIDMSLFKRTTR